MRIYKTIEQDNGKLTIYGSNRDIRIEYVKPEWANEPEASFRYKNNRYFLSEFMACPTIFDGFTEFDGYMSDSFFSGILIKLSEDGDAVKAFTYIG